MFDCDNVDGDVPTLVLNPNSWTKFGMADIPIANVVMPAELHPAPPNVNAPLIQTVGARLQRVGVPAAFFTSAIYLAHGFNESLLANHLRPIADIDDEVKLERILLLGINQRIFTTIRGMTATQFYQFLAFIRGPAGQTALSQMSVADLLRKGVGTFTAEQMGWLAMFEAQRTDCANRTGDIRRRHELIIADLELSLRDAKAAMETELTAAKTEFIPCGDYVPMTNYEFNQRCWAEYLNTCNVNNVVATTLSEDSVVEAAKTFGDVVRQRHLLDFLSQGDRQTQVHGYVNTKIGQFENIKEERSAKCFRRLLVVVGLAPPPATPQRVPAAVGGAHPSGADPQANADRIFNTHFEDPGTIAPYGEAGDGAQTEADYPAQQRVAPVQQRPPYVSTQHTRSGQPFGRGLAGNTVRLQ